MIKGTMIASGGLEGGISSTIAGGNFWDGFRQGIITSGLNHVAHLVTFGEKTLREEFDGTGLDPDKKATFCDWELLVEKIKSLKRLYSKTQSKFIVSGKLKTAGGKWIAETDKIDINPNDVGTM